MSEIKPGCRHCGYTGKMLTITDSEGKACTLRKSSGSKSNKQLEYLNFGVCPKCLGLNSRK